MEGLTLKQRWKASTPKFWKKVQKTGLILTAIGTAVSTAPVALPAAVVSIAAYAAVGGGLIAAMAQLTVEDPQVQN